MSFSDQDLERYARHIVLREVGGAGQAKLQASRVLVIGAGGLGSPVILYLAAAGVGTLGIADFDTVSLSNLQRQIAHRTADIGRPKTQSAADAARAFASAFSAKVSPSSGPSSTPSSRAATPSSPRMRRTSTSL